MTTPTLSIDRTLDAAAYFEALALRVRRIAETEYLPRAIVMSGPDGVSGFNAAHERYLALVVAAHDHAGTADDLLWYALADPETLYDEDDLEYLESAFERAARVRTEIFPECRTRNLL